MGFQVPLFMLDQERYAAARPGRQGFVSITI